MKKKIIGKKNEPVKQTNITKLPLYDIYCNVRIRNNTFKIYCGDGRQNLNWLSTVVLHNYNSKSFAFNTGKIKYLYFLILGLASAFKFQDGTIITDLSELICSTLKDTREEIWLMLKEEYDDFIEESKKRKTIKKSISPNK